MESLKPPKTIKFYQLIKMGIKPSLNFSSSGSASANYVGPGFYRTLEEAEHNRTIEALKETDGSTFHIFELEFPNPAYQD